MQLALLFCFLLFNKISCECSTSEFMSIPNKSFNIRKTITNAANYKPYTAITSEAACKTKCLQTEVSGKTCVAYEMYSNTDASKYCLLANIVDQASDLTDDNGHTYYYSTCSICSTPTVTNGNVTVDQSPATDGSTATITCDTGFYMSGESSLTCNAPDWSAATPSCLQITCPLPDKPENGDYSSPDTLIYLSEVKYACNEGYDLVGTDTGVCKESKNVEPDPPICQITTCEVPTIDHGSCTGTTDPPEYDTSITCTCESEKYKVVGESNLKCLGHNNYDQAAPTCELIVCPRDLSLENGVVNYGSEDQSTVGDTVEFSCNTGYNLVGDSSAACTTSATWDKELPTCEIVNCTTPTVPENGDMSTSTENLVYLSEVKYTCIEGYDLVGSNTGTCKESGNVEPDAPKCEITTCQLYTFDHGSCTGTANPAQYGESATCACESEKYKLIGESTLKCLGHDTYDKDEKPTCEFISCPRDFSIDNGKITYSTDTVSSVGDSTEFACSSNKYKLNGQTSATCGTSGTWDNSAPECELIQCPNPADPTNGKATYTSLGVDDVVSYTCNSGYKISGSASVTCTTSGTWNSDMPTCERVTCSNPGSPSHGSISGNSEPIYPGTTVKYSCKSGYKVSGSSSSTCNDDGSWSDSKPSCKCKSLICL